MSALIALPLLLLFLAWVFSAAGTALALELLTKARILDTPNERSNHARVVPRGGGIAMILSMLLCLSICGMNLWIGVAALLLMAISFADDMRGMPPGIRFAVQLVAVLVALPALSGRLLPFLPMPLEYAAVALIWLWFINLTNFMDGIDGITSLEMMLVSVGILLMRIVVPTLPLDLAFCAAVVAASVLGFYGFNRPPARLFMGDAGSIPLGFLMGWLLLRLAYGGCWFAALILPAYYLADATTTLLKRLLRGEKIWQAHSQHAYQQAVRAGRTHSEVVNKITILNCALVLLAMWSATSMMAGFAALFAAYFLTFCLLRHFTHEIPAA